MHQRLEYALAAAQWLGTKEGSREHRQLLALYNSLQPLPRGYAMTERDPWCAAFVCAAAVQAGVEDRFPMECSCPRIVEQAKQMGIWVENDAYVPRIGDWVLYDWDAEGTADAVGSPDHIGVVVGLEDGMILAAEGNYDNAVKLRRVPINWEKLRGFVCPEFEEAAMLYHTLEEVPEYARATIQKLTENGSLRGVAQDDLGLTVDLLRTLVILDRLGKL